MNDFTDIDELLTSEDLEGASEDFHKPEGFAPILPGRYLSRSRKLESAKTQKGKPAFKVSFNRDSNWTTLKGEPVRAFPPFETLYFHKSPVFGGEGEISSASAYLRAAKLKFQNWKEGEVSQLMTESQDVPVVVIVGWEQDYKEIQGQLDEAGKPVRPKKTAFFKDPQSGKYLHEKKDQDGNIVKARAKVVGYEVYKG
jgi:hypothetical protein